RDGRSARQAGPRLVERSREWRHATRRCRLLHRAGNRARQTLASAVAGGRPMTSSFDTPLSLAFLRDVYEKPVKLVLSEATKARIDRGAQIVAKIVDSGSVVYGVNTGFGLLASKVVGRDDLEALQRNLVLSHACGVGPDLPDAVVRLILVLKVASLCQGAS